jgi:cobalt-zinc-cadmium efflux system membrane fusion protein
MAACFRKYFLALCALLLLLGMTVAVPVVVAHDNDPIGPYGEPIPVSALGKSAIGLQVEVVHKTSLPMQIAVPGKIEAVPARQFDQHAPLSGRVSKVTVVLGESIKAGQVLAIIDSPEMNQLAAQLLQSKLETESEYSKQNTMLGEEVRQAERRLELAEQNLRRNQKLLEEKIAAQKDVMAAENEFDLAQTRVRTAVKNREIVLSSLKAKIDLIQNPLRQRLEMLGVDTDHINTMLKNQTTLTSVPVQAARTGVLTDIQATPGMSIDPSVRLFTISDLSKVWATAQVYEDDMSRMKLGEKVLVKVHALSGEQVQGVLTSIGSQVDPQTRTLPVRAELFNSDSRLKPDMYAELEIQTAESSPMIALPRDAVVQRGGHHLVFTESTTGFQPTYVKTGRNVGDEIEIVDGIKPGERVVVRGAFQLGAQLVKNQEGEAEFTQPTEGERFEDNQSKTSGTLTLNVQTVLMIVAAAFLFGFGISAVLLVRNRSVLRDSGKQSPLRAGPPTDSVVAPDELPAVGVKGETNSPSTKGSADS